MLDPLRLISPQPPEMLPHALDHCSSWPSGVNQNLCQQESNANHSWSLMGLKLLLGTFLWYFFGNNRTCCFQSAEIYKPMKDLLLDKISLEGIEISHPTNAIVKVKCQPTACFFNIQASEQLMGFSTRSKVCKVLLGIIAPGILPQKNPQTFGKSSGKLQTTESPRARSKETNQKCFETHVARKSQHLPKCDTNAIHIGNVLDVCEKKNQPP